MSRSIYLLPLACLLGFAVGSWGPRADLRELRARGADEKRAAADKKPDGFGTFAQIAKIPESARHPRRRRAPRAAEKRPAIAVTNAPKTAVSESVTEPTNAVPEKAAAQVREDERPSPDDLRARIDEAQEMWATRVDIARAQWKSKLNLSGDAEKAFDDALQEMNEKLYASVEALAARLASEEKMSPELGFRLMGDTTTIMAETYDRIGACVAPDRRGDVSEMQMVDFIDPAVAEPLVDVQDKLEGFSMHRGREGK